MATKSPHDDADAIVKIDGNFAYMVVAGKNRQLPVPSPLPPISTIPWLDDEDLAALLEHENSPEGRKFYAEEKRPLRETSLFDEKYPGCPSTRLKVDGAVFYGGISLSNITNEDLDRLMHTDLGYAKDSFEQGHYTECYESITQILLLCKHAFEYPSHEDVPLTFARQRERKTYLLRELINFGRESGFIFLSNEGCLRAAFDMISSNIFRGSIPRMEVVIDEDDPPVSPRIWTDVLHLCYDFFLNILSFQSQPELPPNHPPGLTELTRVLKQLINGPFVLKLVDAFNSDITVERDFLKTLLHRIYAKFMSLRATIRKALNSYFFVFVYERDDLFGVSEMLEILGSIINGFALPLKAEHIIFFRRVLLVLHKSPRITHFFPQLSYCVVQFVDKDPALALDVFNALFRFWPLTSSSKAVMFLTTLEECLEVVDPLHPKTFDSYEVIAAVTHRGMSSPHFAVAERAACIWQSEICSQILCDRRALPQLIGGERFAMFAEPHWNLTIKALMEKIYEHILSEQRDIALHAKNEYENIIKTRVSMINNPPGAVRPGTRASRERKAAFYNILAKKVHDEVSGFPAPPKHSAADLLPPFA